ncbi:tripartite tricarboxylate transporter substrate binding protein [Verticiella sediminum]|uniref:Tripartite tricarboxylate transporter substrate binding protein n=1 Tax=Verticiella sediminum TaxID=1247510 RepID=A0A556B1G4_9BURK|nr:tripartite tricarboxylate transporter substrate binding protein [Verticiella sediminum]TSH98575.1 tripartite tricarboxylate transporter substrate binding protein [Verticiella sediminum]
MHHRIAPAALRGRLRRRLAGLGLALVASLSGLAHAAYPEQPIRVVVPFAAGSGTDNGVRTMTNYVSQQTGWTMIVDNKPGGNGIIGVQDFLRAAPDGYTIISTGNTTHAANPVLFKQLPYDPVADFVPIHRSLVAPLALFVSPKHKIGSVKELVDFIRSKPPGSVTYAAGSASHRASAERFNQEAGLETVHVPYKSSPQALTDLMGGHVDFMFVDTAAVVGQIQGGAMKPLAVTSPQRVPVIPEVPTMIESGFPGYVMSGWSVMFAHKGTPPEAVDALRKALADYSHSETGRKYRDAMGAYYEDLTPEQLQAFIRDELKLYQDIYRKAGIQPE